MIVHRHRALAFVSLVLSVASGCETGDKPRPLSQAGFNAQAPHTEHSVPMSTLSHADQPGAIESGARTGPVVRPPLHPDRDEGLSQIVQENIKRPGVGSEDLVDESATAEPRARTHPTTGSATLGASSGNYYEIGGVVMEVNGTPIYANKVVSLLEPVFAADAKQYDRAQFRTMAETRIKNQITELKEDQLQYAAAEHHLDKKEKDMADALTIQWRMKQIADAGGSLSVARDRAAARGEDFDDMVKQEYRVWMSRIYFERKIIPQIQVSAADMREYYKAHRDTEFTDLGSASFRLIMIDPAKRSGRQPALDLITELRNRIAKAGESFDGIARSVNDDPRFLKSGGDLGTAIQEHAFVIPAVEQAVWATPVGEVTPVVEANGAFYIALVEQKTPSKVHAFDEEAVQSRIDYELRTAQFRDMRRRCSTPSSRMPPSTPPPKWSTSRSKWRCKTIPAGPPPNRRPSRQRKRLATE